MTASVRVRAAVLRAATMLRLATSALHLRLAASTLHLRLAAAWEASSRCNPGRSR